MRFAHSARQTISGAVIRLAIGFAWKSLASGNRRGPTPPTPPPHRSNDAGTSPAQWAKSRASTNSNTVPLSRAVPGNCASANGPQAVNMYGQLSLQLAYIYNNIYKAPALLTFIQVLNVYLSKDGEQVSTTALSVCSYDITQLQPPRRNLFCGN